MRKIRRLHVVESDYFTVFSPAATPPGDEDPLSNISSNSGLISFSPNNSGNGSASLDNPPIIRAHFSASIAILLVGLLIIVFFTGFFSIYIRRLTFEEETARRRAAVNGRMRYRAPQGLDSTVIETLPLFKYSLMKGLKQGKQASECVVCLSEYEDGEMLRLLPKCGHSFHPDCIDMWLFSHTTCPLCRTSLVAEGPVNVVPQQVEVNIEGQSQQTAEHTVIVVGGENGGFDDNGRGRTTSRNEMMGRTTSPGHGLWL